MPKFAAAALEEVNVLRDVEFGNTEAARIKKQYTLALADALRKGLPLVVDLEPGDNAMRIRQRLHGAAGRLGIPVEVMQRGSVLTCYPTRAKVEIPKHFTDALIAYEKGEAVVTEKQPAPTHGQIEQVATEAVKDAVADLDPVVADQIRAILAESMGDIAQRIAAQIAPKLK